MPPMRIWIWLTLLAATIAIAGCLIETPTLDAPSTTEPARTTPLAPTAAPAATATLPSSQGTVRRFSSVPPLTIDVSAEYTATFRTNQGNFKVELFAGQAPITVNNFVFLADGGFYNGLIFHRVIDDFMIQGGDPQGTGSGGPGYQFQDEIVASLVFDSAGILAMANAGPNTNGSQFFITTVPTPHLNGNHTIFGQVIEGQDVVDAISRVDTNNQNRPLNSVTIENVEIVSTPR